MKAIDIIKYLDMISDWRNEEDLDEDQEVQLDELEAIIEFGEPTLDHLQMVEERVL